MDNFTLAVIVSDVAMIIIFIALIVLDKPRAAVPAGPTGPVKPAGKRSA